MCTLFANLYVLLTWGPHMVYMGTPYIFDMYMIRCGWLGSDPQMAISPAPSLFTLPHLLAFSVCLMHTGVMNAI